jgi:RecG-like helicase
MNKNSLIQETKDAFEILYMPMAIMKQRLNGQDFLEVAIEIMREAKRNNVFEEHKYLIATTLVNEFNKKLNPKMTEEQKQAFIKVLTGNSMFYKI